VPYTNQPFNEPNWFSNYSWTAEQQAEFKEWLFEYLKANKGDLRLIATRMPFTRRYFEKLYCWIDLDYGFKDSKR